MQIRGFYTRAQFGRLIEREDRIELKTGVGITPLQEAMVALSNTDGGAILIGVNDQRQVLGRRLDQGVQDKIHEAALAVRDVGRYRILEVDVESRPVVAITVERRIEGFSQTSDGRILVRRGERNTSLFGADLARFISERALRRFELADTELTQVSIRRDFLTELNAAYEWGPSAIEDRLEERGLLTSDGNLTLCGALFLTDPAQELQQGKALVEVRRYPEDAGEYDRREEFGGPLHHQVAGATEFVMAEIGSDLVVTGLYRHELSRLPHVVVREAIANAVAHRSYETQGSSIVIELYQDRVVVTSPGGLPEPVTVENIRQAQAARNQNIIDVLRRFRLAEDAGRGIDVMQDSMDEALLDPPTFEDRGHAVRVTLPLRGPITARERAWVSDLERRGEIRGRDRLLLVHAARGERLTNAQARQILAVDQVSAREALQRLRDSGLLVQSGSRGGATYLLVEDLAPPAAFRMSSGELGELVLREAEKRPISNEMVRRLTGLDRPKALALLRTLVRQGHLERTGEKRGSWYTPKI